VGRFPRATVRNGRTKGPLGLFQENLGQLKQVSLIGEANRCLNPQDGNHFS